MKEEIFRIDNGQLMLKGQKIFNSIYLQVFAGETLGIIFDNMEEKNAFLKLLNGDARLSYGRMYINEEVIEGNNDDHSVKQNIFTITESSKLIKQMKIYENIFLFHSEDIFLKSGLYRKKTQMLFEHFNIDIPLNKPIPQLTSLESITIELLKAFTLDSRLIVLSNITSILNTTELITFFELVNKLKRKGVGFIVTETFEDIVFEQTNQLCLIKNGKTIGLFNSANLNRKMIYQLLNAKQTDDSYKDIGSETNTSSQQREVVLSLNNIYTSVLQDISLDIRRGEILKIFYMDDESKNDLIGLLNGTIDACKGRITVNNNSYSASGIADAQEKGVCFVEENPTEVMLFKRLSVMYNLCIPLSNKVNWFWVKSRYGKSVIKTLEQLIAPSYFKKPVYMVPPSVQQKVVYCKWLLYSPRVLVCIKPFSITDVKVNQITEEMINLLADRGIAILIVTSNWPSLSDLKGDTIYLKDGRLGL